MPTHICEEMRDDSMILRIEVIPIIGGILMHRNYTLRGISFCPYCGFDLNKL